MEAFVNPSGHVHETVTLLQAQGECLGERAGMNGTSLADSH
jgi:hypothetical protein